MYTTYLRIIGKSLGIMGDICGKFLKEILEGSSHYWLMPSNYGGLLSPTKINPLENLTH